MDIRQYKAILFDWDGTLVDSTDWVLGAHNHVRERMEMPLWTKDDIFGSSSQSTRELYPKIYGEDAHNAISMLSDYVSEKNLEGATPYDNAEHLLKILHNIGLPLGVVSNKRHEPLNEMVDHLKWRKYFMSTIGAGHAERDKPHPSSVVMAMAEMDKNLKPKDILYVGDTETDLLTAQNSGCDVAFIQSDGLRADLVEKYNPNYVFSNLDGFIEAVTSCAEEANKKAI